MPQGPFQVVTLSNASQTELNISDATVVKSSNGFVATISVIETSSTAGAIYDATSVTGNTSANQIATIPATVGTYAINFIAKNGIVVDPGASQVVAISFT